jgi:serine/threonine-protein kinase
LREGALRLAATDADYAAFVDVERRIDSGEVPLEPELERLEAIVATSPGLLPAHLRAAATALTLHSDTRDDAFLRRAGVAIRRARELAPDHPTAIQLELRAALAGGERGAAEAALAELRRVRPESVLVDLGRSLLAEHDGDLGAAVTAMEAAVERVPSWQNLYRLAALELRRGDVDEARGWLEELLRRAPANSWGLARLAGLELFHGDLHRAETLFLRALEVKRHRSYLTNLGLTRLLLGRHGEAKAAFLEALELQPGDPIARLNLADAELAAGDGEAARARYREVLAALEGRELDAALAMTRAQCRARLGDFERAVAETLDTLQRHPEDAEVAYQAALVYALAGERASALANVERALERGVQPRWFRIPGFESLADHPRFRELVPDPEGGG